MAYEVKVIKKYVSQRNAHIATVQATYPRFIHSQVMTYRMFSRNTCSSRAIPIEKLILQVENDPVIPVYWGKNQKGMQSYAELPESVKADALSQWMKGRDRALETARELLALGVHKQLANRVLEPYAWITAIITATEWQNYFVQRCEDAQPEHSHLACMIRDAFSDAKQYVMYDGEWSTPYIDDETWKEVSTECHSLVPANYEAMDWQYADRFRNIIADMRNDKLKKISVARCARVSYLTHEGKREISKDLELYRDLHQDGHWSPFEHVVTPSTDPRNGNLFGWKSFRKFFKNENHGREMD